MFKFSDYLRICREEKHLTQGELVTQLITLDKTFNSLDTTTLSRWERGVSKPSLSKQTLIILFFSRYFKRIYPFIEQAEQIDIEQSFCALGFSKLLGRHKLIMNFPTHHMDKKQFKIELYQNSTVQQSALKRNEFILKEMYDRPIDEALQKSFALNQANHFSICEYQNEYYGHFFAIKLTPEAFDQVINFELNLDQLNDKHFSAIDEIGCYFFFGFFGMSDLVISMIWVNFYSWVIKQQSQIKEMGAIISTKEGEMIAKNMNTELYNSVEISGRTFQSFCATTEDMLITENVVKMLFNPESCPDDN